MADNKITIEALRLKVRKMSRFSLLYKMLKEELNSLGYWKNKPRGNPRKGYEATLAKGK